MATMKQVVSVSVVVLLAYALLAGRVHAAGTRGAARTDGKEEDFSSFSSKNKNNVRNLRPLVAPGGNNGGGTTLNSLLNVFQGKGVTVPPTTATSFPTSSPSTPIPTPDPTPDPASVNLDGDVATTPLLLNFVMFPRNATIAVAPGAPTNALGTVYIFQDSMFDFNLTAIGGTFVSGYCTRLSKLKDLGANNTLVGSGYCHYTLIISDDVGTVSTFIAEGEVLDVFGGTLAVVGGTGALQGVWGEVGLVPFYAETTYADYFTEASLYVGAASLTIPTSTNHVRQRIY